MRGEEHEMSNVADISEPASELERLIADLPESGLLIFVFGAGVGWCTAHLTGVTTPVFRGHPLALTRGPQDRVPLACH
jgi:hypothetical protein